MVVKVGFLKLGCIGSALLLEFMLDERAEREDIDVRVVGAGAKLGIEQAEEAARRMLDFKPQIVIATSPNATLPGPKKAREIIKAAGIPVVVVSDSPAKKSAQELEQQGFGYIIIEADSMIGARREFLDPLEMVLFNLDVARVLAITGALNLLTAEIDRAIESIKKGIQIPLPKIVVDKEKAIKAASFSNPYSATKAMAAYETARRVADLSVEGCFAVKEWERYTQIVSAAHEMMRQAARLADDAREIEKAQDAVSRTPHYDDGGILKKRKLMDKPTKP
ncbi:MAG: F420-dependent methylenetetrahydromethanopterin dehydrogenase [Candidatus Bathyarchaeia archaeon]|jgi:methylenetetrahydromethanopterin dehydrogenase